MGMRGMILLWGKGDPWEPRRRIWKGGQVGKKMSLGELRWGLVLRSKSKEVVRGLRGVGGGGGVQLNLVAQGEAWIIKVCNLNCQGVLQTMPYLIHANFYENCFFFSFEIQ